MKLAEVNPPEEEVQLWSEFSCILMNRSIGSRLENYSGNKFQKVRN